jgi:hypothetical protein
MSEEDRVVAGRRFGNLESVTDEQCEAAYVAAWSVTCTIEAVCMVTVARYASREGSGDHDIISHIPGQIAEALSCAPATEEELDKLRRWSVGQEFPQIGAPIVLDDL